MLEAKWLRIALWFLICRSFWELLACASSSFPCHSLLYSSLPQNFSQWTPTTPEGGGEGGGRADTCLGQTHTCLGQAHNPPRTCRHLGRGLCGFLQFIMCFAWATGGQTPTAVATRATATAKHNGLRGLRGCHGQADTCLGQAPNLPRTSRQ